MSIFLNGGRRITLRQPHFGAGAEGLVFRVEGTDDLCAKIYFEPDDSARTGRLGALRRAAPASWDGDNREHHHVAWPREVLYSKRGEPVGFLMSLEQGVPLQALFDPRQRIDALADPTWRALVAVAARVARLFALLHDVGIVIGDVSPTNMLASPSGHVTLIDCDAVQFTDPQGGTRYSCGKVTPEYTPPMPPSRNGRALTPAHDNFALAVLVCQLLMEGEHPFEGVLSDPQAPDYTAPENIQQQNNRIISPERFVSVAGAIPPTVLPPEVLELARACFGAGHRDPEARPTAQDWAKALDTAGFQTMGCRKNDRHQYHNSLSGCVWCATARSGFGDHYPASAKSKATAAVGNPQVVASSAGAAVPRTAYPPPPAPPLSYTTRTKPPLPHTAPPTQITATGPRPVRPPVHPPVPASTSGLSGTSKFVIAVLAIGLLILLLVVVFG